MTRPRLRVVTGSAVLVASALVATGCGLVGGGGDTYSVSVFFPRAVALYERSNVRVLGLPAGTVTDIEVEGDRVRVVLELDSDIPVPVDATAALVPQSLIGERYVQLMPAWIEGDDRLQDLPADERVIELEQTIVPVEPDDALAATNEFLQSLNPEGLGRLIGNLAETLDGNGATLNSALASITGLVDTFAARDEQLAAIVENLDVLTSTLAGREAQIGRVLDSFAQATTVLAQERQSIERFVAAVANISEVGLNLVADNSAQLREDLDTLGRLSQSLVANLDAVGQLLDAGPNFVRGAWPVERGGIYDPVLNAVNLRNHFTPNVSRVLNVILQDILGVPIEVPCIGGVAGIIDAVCEDGGLIPLTGQAGSDAVTTELPPAWTPVDDVLSLLGAPAAPPAAASSSPSTADRVADGMGGVGGFLRDMAEALAGAGS
ncbi:MAG: MCE family protein [Acidimicrobiales bacterium]